MKQGFLKFSSMFSILSPFLALIAYFYLFQTIIYVQYITATLITVILTIVNMIRQTSKGKTYVQFILLLLFNSVFMIQVLLTNNPGFAIALIPELFVSFLIVIDFHKNPDLQSNSGNILFNLQIYLLTAIMIFIALFGYTFGFIALDGGIH